MRLAEIDPEEIPPEVLKAISELFDRISSQVEEEVPLKPKDESPEDEAKRVLGYLEGMIQDEIDPRLAVVAARLHQLYDGISPNADASLSAVDDMFTVMMKSHVQAEIQKSLVLAGDSPNKEAVARSIDGLVEVDAVLEPFLIQLRKTMLGWVASPPWFPVEDRLDD